MIFYPIRLIPSNKQGNTDAINKPLPLITYVIKLYGWAFTRVQFVNKSLRIGGVSCKTHSTHINFDLVQKLTKSNLVPARVGRCPLQYLPGPSGYFGSLPGIEVLVIPDNAFIGPK